MGQQSQFRRGWGFAPFLRGLSLGGLDGTPPHRRDGRHLAQVGVGETRYTPRWRDGLAGRRGQGRAGRNTPALAGRTNTGGGCRPAAAKHPRVGGTDKSAALHLKGTHGTPPRLRDGRVRRPGLRERRRNTLASAGQTSVAMARSRLSSEHPRVSGTDPSSRISQANACGTPPRRRDGPCGLSWCPS